MSEYPMTQSRSSVPESDANTLFDGVDDAVFKDDAVEHVVDTQGVSYDAARRVVGVEARQYDTPTPETAELSGFKGISVDLGARAVAITNIMKAYSQTSKTLGAEERNDFEARYRHPGEVLVNMDEKAKRMERAANKDYAVLSGRADFLAAGAPLAMVDAIEDSIKRDVRKAYGPGKTNYRERDKVKRKVAATARKANKSKAA